MNAPMIAINDDYYEDLTPQGTLELLEKVKKGEKVTPGPLSGRKSCEPLPGPNVLKDKPYGPGDFLRADL